MYVIFPADEVVYLSYGRLIVVPANSSPENSNSPIRTTSFPFEYNTGSNIPLNTSSSTGSKGTAFSEPLSPASRIECNLLEGQPSSSRGCNRSVQDTVPSEPIKSQETKPKKRSLRLNFNLLRKNNSKSSDLQGTASPRVRYSVGNKEQAGVTTPPSEAFKKFCHISSPETKESSLTELPLEAKKYLKEKEKSSSVQGINSQEKTSSKRSSSSSKNSKPSSIVQEDQISKKSSKHSSSSSRSTRQERSLSSTLANSTTALKRSESQIQRNPHKEPSRKTSAPTNLSAEAFYPLSTSREKNLVEPSPEPQIKGRSSSFRINLRRSKTPEVPTSQPSRPERRKEKRDVKPKGALNRKLSFSDFLAVSRERTTDIYPEVVVTSDRNKSNVERDKSPVLSLFRKPPSPRNLGRDRTPHLSRESGLHTNQNLLRDTRIEDNSRPANTGQTHASGEGAIMRVAIFNTNCTNNVIISLALLTGYRLWIFIIMY